jgi:hypothetical protein
MDFVTGLSPSKNLNSGKDYDLILVIVDKFSKMARYTEDPVKSLRTIGPQTLKER